MRSAVRRQGNLSVAIVLGLAALAIVNYLAFRHHARWDWTTNQFYSLSPQTLEVLEKLQQDVRLVPLFSALDAGSIDAVEQINAQMESYAATGSKRVRIERVDPLREPLKVQALLNEFGIELRDADVVIVASGARHKQIRLEELVEFDSAAAPDGSRPIRALKAEDVLTSAIRAVTRAEKPVVRVAQGHGEREMSAIRRLGDALQRTDVSIEPWDAAGASAVPPDTAALLILGPSVAWLPPELAAVEQYLAEGGRVLFALEPVLQQGSGTLLTTGLEPLLERRGVTVTNDIVIDPARGVPFYGPETFLGEVTPDHPIGRSLPEQQALIALARSLAVAGAETPARVGTIVRTSPSAWGETSFTSTEMRPDAADPAGPLSIVVASTDAGDDDQDASATDSTTDGTNRRGDRERAQRFVAAGDVDFLTDSAFDQLANRALALNVMSWLLDDQSSLGIPPKDRTLARLLLTESQAFALAAWMTFGLPLLSITLGFVVWWRRRQNR